MLILASWWSTQKTQDFVVFWPLIIPSTTSSRSSALVLSQFFSPDLTRTFSTSMGMLASERTCSILSRSVSLDLFIRLMCFSLWGCGVGQPTNHSLYPSSIEHRHHVTSRILKQLHESSGPSFHGNRGIASTPFGYHRNSEFHLWNRPDDSWEKNSPPEF